MAHWTDFGIRELPIMSGREKTPLPPFLQPWEDLLQSLADAPLRGMTTDGTVRPGLFTLGPSGVSTRPVYDAAMAFLGSLSAAERAKAVFPLDAKEQHMWLNVHMYMFRHGLSLEDLDQSQRDLGLALMRSCLSERGYGQARDIMRVNGLLTELTNSPTEYGEWPYWVSFFGEPSEDRPWGWQIDGHHLAVNVIVIGDQLAFTPTFMGSEPCRIDSGPLAGIDLFRPEEHSGLALMKSLDVGQAAQATLYTSILPDDIPQSLQDPVDGRMQAGAFKDNAVIPFEGVRADGMTDSQRALLRTVIGSFTGWGRDGHAQVKMAEVDAHLDETYFAWMGAVTDGGPFYYRVHSPVVMIEFDHHPGVVFDNLDPSPHHIHSIIRTPNGGDYGVDLLRQHHERYDHSHGGHESRH